MKANIIETVSLGSSDFVGNSRFTFLTNTSDDAIEIEGIEEELEDDSDLPAPLPAMASIATALADFPSPPVGVQQAIKNESEGNVKRKRSSGGDGKVSVPSSASRVEELEGPNIQRTDSGR